MKVVALAGGVGGAKLADGLAQVLDPGDLTVIVNTGDDFEHLGLLVSPDLDTVCYTLAGLANPATGWGLKGDSWRVIERVERLGGPAWFRVGDLDLATHLERTRRIRAGDSLSRITHDFCRASGLQHVVLPMSDDSVRTIVVTDQGDLEFQEYFVHRGCAPRVRGFRFDGAAGAHAAPGVVEALQDAQVIVICPSNPWVSIGPMLAMPGLRSAIDPGRTVAVSPIVGGRALKGPAAKMYKELGIGPSAAAVAQQYSEHARSFVLDEQDAALVEDIRRMGMRVLATQTVMISSSDRSRLAQAILDFVGETAL
jgi:LPPG:FO 2-phospho-L-lactate transferase